MKTVWLLGAGASVSHSKGHFPSLVGLPRATRRLGVIETDPLKNDAYKHLQDYLSRRGFPPFDGDRDLNLEAVLTSLEIDIEVSPTPQLLVAHDLVLRILRVTIRQLQQEDWTSAKEYDRLVAALQSGDSIITFNWDCVLDNVLQREAMLAEIDKPGQTLPAMKEDTLYGEFLLRFTGWGETTYRGLRLPSDVTPKPVPIFMSVRG